MKYGLTIQATLFTRESCLKLDVRATGYVTMPGFPQVHLISHATFLNASTGAPLVVEQVNYGAGGGGGDGGEFLMEEQLDYDVKSSLAVTRVTAMVTFNEALGITEPVRFDLEPTSRPIMYCPQLPPTTPEG